MIDLAPGQTSGPFFTSFWRDSMFKGVTVSGKVRFMAIDLGTPS